MRIVDLNILLYAVNSDAAQHDFVRSWWEKALNDEDTVGLTWVVLLGFLRLATNSRVFPLKRGGAMPSMQAKSRPRAIAPL